MLICSKINLLEFIYTQNVVKVWNVGHNGRTRWSIDCDYPNAKFNNYIASKLMLDFSKCEDHCLSIKDCTHFAVWMKTCWVKNMREASIVQIVDRGVQICGFVPVRGHYFTFKHAYQTVIYLIYIMIQLYFTGKATCCYYTKNPYCFT